MRDRRSLDVADWVGRPVRGLLVALLTVLAGAAACSGDDAARLPDVPDGSDSAGDAPGPDVPVDGPGTEDAPLDDGLGAEDAPLDGLGAEDAPLDDGLGAEDAPLDELGAGDAEAGADADADLPAEADSEADSSTEAPADADGSPEVEAEADVSPPPAECAPLPPPAGETVTVGPDEAGDLPYVTLRAAPGTTILLEDGTYDMRASGLGLWYDGLTLRSASGNREAVILDGGYEAGEVIMIAASNVTVADLTIRRAYNHPIHVWGGETGDIENVRLYNLHIIDPGQQAVKINRSYEGTFVDRGRVECSLIELTDEGRGHVRDSCYTGGIDAHGAWGWVVRLNTVRGFWCGDGLSEHGIHFWQASRDTLIERNLIVDCARGIGLGLVDSASGTRVYDPDPYPGVGYIDHYGGVVRNNMVFAGLAGFDCGICLHQARGATAAHNTVFTTTAPDSSSIEWRWPNTQVDVVNNLVSHDILDRGGSATLAGNIEGASASLFVDPVSGDLHLLPSARTAIDTGAPLDPGVCDDDFDGQARGALRDVGADEVRE